MRRHMTSHGVIRLKSLEPSCSAGGAGLGDAPASECLSLRQAATGGDDRVVIGRVMSLVLPTPSDRYLQFRLQDPGATGAHTALLFFANYFIAQLRALLCFKWSSKIVYFTFV